MWKNAIFVVFCIFVLFSPVLLTTIKKGWQGWLTFRAILMVCLVAVISVFIRKYIFTPHNFFVNLLEIVIPGLIIAKISMWYSRVIGG